MDRSAWGWRTLKSLDKIRIGTRPYRVYTALLTQIGTSRPSATTVLENTLQEDPIVWTRVGTGHYTFPGTFAVGKTYPYTTDYNTRHQTLINNEGYAVVGWAAVSGYIENGVTLHLYTQDMDGNLADGILTNFPFEVRVYL